MKKYLIIPILLLLLSSCWSNDSDNIINTSSWNIQQEEHKEIIDQNEKQQVEETKLQNHKKLIMKNNNVFLSEDWKEDIVLTTRAKWLDCERDMLWDVKIYSYEILKDSWDYWIVKRRAELCWAYAWYSYYLIDLNSNSDELTLLEDDLYKNDEYDYNIDLQWDILKFSIISFDNYFCDTLEDCSRWTPYVWYLKDDWFFKEWNNWVKSFNLKDILWNNDTQIQNKYNSKYSHDTLIKQWYKLNKIWNISEYYKYTKEDNLQWNWWWVDNYKTVYIEWDKILEINWMNSDTTSWFMATIIISDWENSEMIDENEFWKSDYWKAIFPTQPIFKQNQPKILIYEGLNEVKIVDKDLWINETIWKRK